MMYPQFRFAEISVDLVKESWWMYALAALVTLFIVAGSLSFAFRALKRGKELNMPKDALRRAVVSSVSFSVLPSVGIFIGVITMAGLLGIPLPWIRLSVVGALHYELMAASVAADGITVATMTVQNFVTIAFVMTLSILWGGLFAVFFLKKYQSKVLEKATSGGKQGFGKYLFDAVFIGMISAYAGDAVAKALHFKVYAIENGSYVLGLDGQRIWSDVPTFVPLIVFATAMGAMAIFDAIVRKRKIRWLEDFSLALSMIIGMAAAVLLGLGGIY